RVEERAERRTLAARACEGAVEDVEDRADPEDGGPDPVEEKLVAVLEEDEDRGEAAERHAARRQRVRRHARPRERDHRARRELPRPIGVPPFERLGSGHALDAAGSRLRVDPCQWSRPQDIRATTMPPTTSSQ